MDYSSLIKSITGATHRLQEHVATAANQALVIRNWLVGAWLVEFEQNGKDRAKYGLKLLESVAADLAKKEIKGLTDPRVLRDCRVLYRVYPQIRGLVTREFGAIALPPISPLTEPIAWGKALYATAILPQSKIKNLQSSFINPLFLRPPMTSSLFLSASQLSEFQLLPRWWWSANRWPQSTDKS